MIARPDRPTHRPYARTEIERRFLLEALPSGVDPGRFERFSDLYVRGTHLRIRQVHRPDGTWITTKLGQKIPDPEAPDDPRRRKMTTIYLPHDEISALAALTGLRTVKRRYFFREQGWTWAIDVWEEPSGAAGTILAEVETPTIEELDRVQVPSWATREVTADAGYSAISLAAR